MTELLDCISVLCTKSCTQKRCHIEYTNSAYNLTKFRIQFDHHYIHHLIVLAECTRNVYIFKQLHFKEVGVSGQKIYFSRFLPIKASYFTDSASQVHY